VLGFVAALLLAGTATAGPFTLWVGNDNNFTADVLNTDLTGLTLGSVSAPGLGIAVDGTGEVLYLSDGIEITPYDLATLTAGTAFSPGINMLDLTMAKSGVWAADPDNGRLAGINPSTGLLDGAVPLGDSVITQYDAGDNPLGTISPFNGFSPLGVAWDGTGFWVSQNANDPNFAAQGLLGTPIRRYVQIGGVWTVDFEFIPWPATWVNDPVLGVVLATSTPGCDPIADPTCTVLAGRTPGGLAWDPHTNTLWVGDVNATVWHFGSDGTPLGSFQTQYAGLDGSGPYVGGLDGPSVPEPGTAALLLSALLLLTAAFRRKSHLRNRA
jgi:hypothetical protein